MQKRYNLILTSEVQLYPKDVLHLEQIKEYQCSWNQN